MTDVFGQHQPKIPYRPIADLLAAYRQRDPDKLAIVDLDQKTSISFGALDAAVTEVAAALRGKGVGKGRRVVLLSDENLEKLLIWLAIWRLGAVVAPLNIELNETLIAELAAIVDPVLALVHKEFDGKTLLAGKPFIRFGSFSPNAADADAQDDFFRTMPRDIAPESLPERNAAEDIAAIFCTSGTTSRPKLVVYDHCAYWLNGLSSLEALGLNEDDRTLEYRSFGWNSAQVVSLMPFLEKGLTMHVARRFSHSHFFDWIQTYGITFAVGVPTVVNMLLNKPLGYTAKDVPTLRLMNCSTAPLTRDQWLRFEEMYGVKLLQMYGMSEAGWICCNRHYRSRMGTVGVPALHQEFEIVDGDGRPCPPNVEGEVTVGGPHCGVGYLLDDGTIDLIRGKRTKSGDLAAMDDDGFVRVTGRTKDLIIRGGVNIAPLEIDAVLLKHPSIADAAAIGVPDKIYGEEVICYVVPRPGASLTEAEVVEHCRAQLPAPKVPKQVFIVTELPKNDRGKVLRDKLKDDWNERARLGGERGRVAGEDCMGLPLREGNFESGQDLRLELEQLRTETGILRAERDAYLQQRDVALGERNEYLRQRDEAIGQHNMQTESVVGLRLELEQLRTEAGILRAERDAYLPQRDVALGERNEYLRQRDEAIGRHNMQTERVVRLVHRADMAARRVVSVPAAATRDRILIFLHLAKTGGVTMNDIIVRNLAIGEFLVIDTAKSESVLWTWSPDEVERAIGRLRSDDVDRLRALLGHYRFGIHAHLPKPSACMTLLRDPVDRVLSYFCYDVIRGARTEPDGSHPSLADYVDRKRHYDLALDNYMTRIMSGLTDLDPIEGTTENCRRVTDDDFKVALTNMTSCLVVGLTDQFDETLVILGSDLRWSLSDLVYTRQNVTSSRPAVRDLSASVYDKIMAWNRYDAMLVDHARIHLAGRIAAYPGNFQADLALFRRLNALFAHGASLDELHRVEYDGVPCEGKTARTEESR